MKWIECQLCGLNYAQEDENYCQLCKIKLGLVKPDIVNSVVISSAEEKQEFIESTQKLTAERKQRLIEYARKLKEEEKHELIKYIRKLANVKEKRKLIEKRLCIVAIVKKELDKLKKIYNYDYSIYDKIININHKLRCMDYESYRPYGFFDIFIQLFRKSKDNKERLVLEKEREELYSVINEINQQLYSKECYKSLIEIDEKIDQINLDDPDEKFYIAEKEREEIKRFLEERNIKYLIHFTNTENIESIRRLGLFSLSELSSRYIGFRNNDQLRLDGHRECISLSVTKVNSRLLNSFKRRKILSQISIIYIDASILYKEFRNKRYYCDRNAAAKSCKKGAEIQDLKRMFIDGFSYSTRAIGVRGYNRKVCKRKPNETTDPQAEILFYNRVHPKYILKIEEY